MSAAGPLRPTTISASASPLNQITNEHASVRSSHESHDEAPQRRLRRTKSARYLRTNMASSESPPDDDSIYNAERVGSSEDLGWAEEPRPEYAAEASAARSLPWSSTGPSNESIVSHSRWPAPQLNTILEANSIYSLRTSHSLPRLRASPERISRVVHPQSSFNSIHPRQAPEHLTQAQSSVPGYKRRSFSLNDLDCILIQSVVRNRSAQSSASEDALEQPPWCPTFPNRPLHPPPYRMPTPPGLPPFGTQQATEYRLRPNRRSIWHRVWRDSHDESDEQRAPSPRSVGSSSSNPQSQSASPSGEVFKRTLAMIGMSRVVTPPPPSAGPSRSSLPPGVYTTNTPGPLARADDGTYVRGRFGPRSSGHGIGLRSLESHPLAQLNSIDEQIREIDKACSRADLQRALSRSVASETDHPSDLDFALRNLPRYGDFRRSRQSSREDGDAYHSGQSPPSYFSSPFLPASEIDIPSSAQREFRRITFPQPRLSLSSMNTGFGQIESPSSPPMMRYGPGVTPSTVISLRSLENDVGGSQEDADRRRNRETSSSEQTVHLKSTIWHQMSTALDDCCRVCWGGRWCRRDSLDE